MKLFDYIDFECYSQLKAHFSTRGVPESESLEVLAAGMTKKSAAQLFYQTCGIITYKLH